MRKRPKRPQCGVSSEMTTSRFFFIRFDLCPTHHLLCPMLFTLSATSMVHYLQPLQPTHHTLPQTHLITLPCTPYSLCHILTILFATNQSFTLPNTHHSLCHTPTIHFPLFPPIQPSLCHTLSTLPHTHHSSCHTPTIHFATPQPFTLSHVHHTLCHAPSIHSATYMYTTPFCHCLLYTSPSPRDSLRSRMPSSA